MYNDFCPLCKDRTMKGEIKKMYNDFCPLCKEQFYYEDRVVDIKGKTYHLECLEEDGVEETLSLFDIVPYGADGPVYQDDFPRYGSLADPNIQAMIGIR